MRASDNYDCSKYTLDLPLRLKRCHAIDDQYLNFGPNIEAFQVFASIITNSEAKRLGVEV
jgi:hypothetical protein